MHFIRFLSDSNRWDWFAAGDETVAKPAPRSAQNDNSTQQLLFEIGLTLAIPLALAASLALIFGA
ncbi:MAG TPA: hypothetical protein VII56_03270 [Rhizomicrobium sp.]